MNSDVRLNYTLLMPLFPSSRNQEIVIEISFETSPKSSALQWLTPEQTSGKEHPYLFSQCQVKKDLELLYYSHLMQLNEAKWTVVIWIHGSYPSKNFYSILCYKNSIYFHLHCSLINTFE